MNSGPPCFLGIGIRLGLEIGIELGLEIGFEIGFGIGFGIGLGIETGMGLGFEIGFEIGFGSTLHHCCLAPLMTSSRHRASASGHQANDELYTTYVFIFCESYSIILLPKHNSTCQQKKH